MCSYLFEILFSKHTVESNTIHKLSSEQKTTVWDKYTYFGQSMYLYNVTLVYEKD